VGWLRRGGGLGLVGVEGVVFEYLVYKALDWDLDWDLGRGGGRGRRVYIYMCVYMSGISGLRLLCLLVLCNKSI
jgi:hypothetical protein